MEAVWWILKISSGEVGGALELLLEEGLVWVDAQVGLGKFIQSFYFIQLD